MKTAAFLAVFASASLSFAQDSSFAEVVDAFDAANVCCLLTCGVLLSIIIITSLDPSGCIDYLRPYCAARGLLPSDKRDDSESNRWRSTASQWFVSSCLIRR